jgi:hypothetical protein
MSESLDQKILAAHQELKTRDKIDRHLEHLNDSFLQLEKRIQMLEKGLLEAGKQLERRQKMADSPMYQLFQFLFQPELETESEIEQENHQYYLKVMELKDMRKQQDLLLFEKKVLLEKKVKLQSLDQELKKMLRKKEYDFSEWSKEDQYRDDLAEEQENIFFQRMLIQEMEEVIQAASLCRDKLNDLIRDITQVHDTDIFEMYGQGRYSSQDKIKFGRRLRAGCDFIGKHLRELNIQLKDISVALQIDYQDRYQYFETFTERFYDILLSSVNGQFSLRELSLHLIHIRNDVIKIIDKMIKDIERSERSIKRSERKKELLILLEIKNRKKKS